MFRRIKQALKKGIPGRAKSLVKFASVGSVGMPEDMTADSEDEYDEEENEDEQNSDPAAVNLYSNTYTHVGSKRVREEKEEKGETKGDEKENRHHHRHQQQQQRLVIENENVSESRKRLADQLASKKTQVTDKRWETDRATARLVDLPEDADDPDWGVFNAAFYGHDGEHKSDQASNPQGSTSTTIAELTQEEKLQMREYLFSKVRHNHVDVVQACIRGKTHDLGSVDDKGNTLLHLAAQNNLKKMAVLLIREGGFDGTEQLNKRNRKGVTPLDYCDLYQFPKLGDWLTLQGAERGNSTHQNKK